MASLTRWVLAHRRLVLVFWIVLTVAGVAGAGPANDAMKQKFSVPGKEGYETNQQIARDFRGTGGNGSPLVPVVALPSGTTVSSSGVRAQLLGVETRLAKALPGARITGYGSTGSRTFVSKDGRTAFVVAFPRADPDEIFGENPKAEKVARAALRGATVGGAPVKLSGFDALSADTGGGGGPGVLIEAMVGGLGALLVLGFVFGSLLAFVPLMMAIPAILTSFLAILGLTQFIEVSPIVSFLIALIGLGVAIDYALIVSVRWREERAKGLDGDEAIISAMESAGRAVVFSGTTVAVGLLALVALPLPFMRSVGIGGMLIPLISVVVALTLLPVILSYAGGRLDWPHRRTDAHASKGWTRWAAGVVHHRWVSAAAAVVVLGALVVAAAGINPGLASTDAIAKAGPARDGLRALERSGIGSGVLVPHEVLIKGGSPTKVATELGKVPGVHGAIAPAGAAWRSGATTLVDVFPTADPSSDSARHVLDGVRSALRRDGVDARVGGEVAQNRDFISAVYGNFPLMIGLIALITFLLLARAFRSLLLPAKAVILNVISVGAAWGVMTLVWQSGHGSDLLFGISPTGAITSWVPLMVFAFLFGLSMDYEVFILARMREEYDATGSTDEAVIRGIGRTGRLVTSAALILFLAFVAMSSGPETDVKVLATGLAAGILLDATIIRALLVPAVVSLFGRWNWVLPEGAAKLLRVEPSLPPRSAPAPSGD